MKNIVVDLATDTQHVCRNTVILHILFNPEQQFYTNQTLNAAECPAVK